LRIILIDGIEWFVAKDMATLLDYKDTDKAIRQHCKKAESLGIFMNPDKLEGLNFQENFGNNFKITKLIPESDVWRLIIKSRLPEAEKIEEWIMEEVLPSIRKTGSYSLQKSETNPQEISLSEIVEQTEKAVEVMKLLENRNAFELFQIDQIAGKFSPTKLLNIDFSQTYFLPTEIGKILGISGAEVNLILEKKGFQFRDENGVWKPTSSAKEFCLEIGGKFSQLK
jgi:prophage antirepressor-like protein